MEDTPSDYGGASVTVYWWESGASLHRMPPGGTLGNLGGRSRYYIRDDEAGRTGYDFTGEWVEPSRRESQLSPAPLILHCFSATILQFKSAILAFSASVQAWPPF
jgi:hypothetical protein